MSTPKLENAPAPTTALSAPVVGLTTGEAASRLDQYGPNDPSPPKTRSAFVDFLRLFLNPLVLILLIAAVVPSFWVN